VDKIRLQDLESILGVTFEDKKWLNDAVTHKSYLVQDSSANHYEKLELLGDAVLDLLILEVLIEKFPLDAEGQLSRKRASLVNQSALNDLAKKLKLDLYIKLSHGEQKTGGLGKASILSSVLESILGAVYMDQGIKIAKKFVGQLFDEAIESGAYFQLDFKTRLQEFVQGKFKSTPYYKLLNTQQLSALGVLVEEFTVGVFIENECWAIGRGRSKKEAEQQAAEMAIKDKMNTLKV